MLYFLLKKHYYFIQVPDSISKFTLHAYVLFISNTYFCCVPLDTCFWQTNSILLEKYYPKNKIKGDGSEEQSFAMKPSMAWNPKPSILYPECWD